jgi:glutathione S-transferase
MVKLYYTPYSCGVSSFISAYISGLNFDCETVELSTHKTESGIDFYTINPKGNVPCLVLDDGSIINENITCLEYIADISLDLAPKLGTPDRYQLNQLLSYLATELHPAFGMFFNPSTKSSDDVKEFVQNNLNKKMAYLEKNILKDKQFIYGSAFSIADAYCHIILSWSQFIGVELSNYTVAYKYYRGICELENVKEAKERAVTKPDRVFE